MCSHLGESYQVGSRDIGSAHAGRPGGCISGHLVPTHVHAAARDHLYGGRSSRGSHTPLGPQLGRTGIHDRVIHPSDSGTGLSKWLKPYQYQRLHRCSNATTGSANWASAVHSHPAGSTMVSTSFPGKQVRSDGSATRPIYLRNDTDSGISCVDHSTPVKAPGCKCQPLASTPKPKPKLLVTAQQHRNELVAMWQGAPHGAHVQPLQHGASRVHPWGTDLFGWNPAMNPRTSRNSSFISVEEHAELTTATLTRRDAPHWPISDDDDIVSVHDDQQSDEEMASVVGHLEQHTKDSSADSAAGGSNHPSDSEMESDYDQESHHCSDPGSDQSSGSDSSSSDDDGGDFMDMFKGKPKHSNTPKKPRQWKHSSNQSRSREMENQK